MSRVTWTIWLAVFAGFGWIAYGHRGEIDTALGVIRHAHLTWVGAAAAAIGGLYLCRAVVYRVPLRLLMYETSLWFLWRVALGASSLHALLPMGGASGYAFLTYAMHQRGVSGAHASLMALLDTLSYATAAGTVVAGTVAWVLATGDVRGAVLATSFVPGLVVVAVAVSLYRLQRDRCRLQRSVLGVQRRLTRWLGRRWSDEGVRRFIDEYYAGKALIGRRPRSFALMVGLQYFAVAADVVALYLACLALSLHPDPAVAVLSFGLAMSGMTLVAAPGGGGSFETIMSAVLASHGFTPPDAIATTLLYRVVAFWLPVLATLGIVLALRRRRPTIQRTARRQ